MLSTTDAGNWMTRTGMPATRTDKHKTGYAQPAAQHEAGRLGHSASDSSSRSSLVRSSASSDTTAELAQSELPDDHSASDSGAGSVPNMVSRPLHGSGRSTEHSPYRSERITGLAGNRRDEDDSSSDSSAVARMELARDDSEKLSLTNYNKITRDNQEELPCAVASQLIIQDYSRRHRSQFSYLRPNKLTDSLYRCTTVALPPFRPDRRPYWHDQALITRYATKSPGWKFLELRFNGLAAGMLEKKGPLMWRAIRFPEDRKVWLKAQFSHCEFDAADAGFLGKMLAGHGVFNNLNLHNNVFDKDASDALMDSLPASSLKIATLERTSLKCRPDALANILATPDLQTLNILESALGPQDPALLAQPWAARHSIVHLSLMDTGIGSDSFQALSSGLAASTSLNYLRLADGTLEQPAVASLLTNLAGNSTLKYLILAAGSAKTRPVKKMKKAAPCGKSQQMGRVLSSRSGRILCHFLETNSSVSHFELTAFDLSPEDKHRLANVLQKRKAPLHLVLRSTVFSHGEWLTGLDSSGSVSDPADDDMHRAFRAQRDLEKVCDHNPSVNITFRSS